MVGLLTALPETRLYRRLMQEGRLETETTGNNTQAALNVRPTLSRDSRMFPSRGGVLSGQTYRYSRNRYIPSGPGNRRDYGIGPVRVYGRSGYYQPSARPVYASFEYWGY